MCKIEQIAFQFLQAFASSFAKREYLATKNDATPYSLALDMATYSARRFRHDTYYCCDVFGRFLHDFKTGFKEKCYLWDIHADVAIRRPRKLMAVSIMANFLEIAVWAKHCESDRNQMIKF